MVCIILIVCLGLGAIGYYRWRIHYYDHQTLSTVVDDLRENALEGYPYARLDTKMWTGMGGSVAYSVPGYTYLVSVEDTNPAYFSVKDGTTASQRHAVLGTIVSRLQESGFQHVSNPPINVSKAPDVYGETSEGFYERQDALWLVGFLGDIMADCTTKTSLSQTAAAVRPFVYVYTDYIVSHHIAPWSDYNPTPPASRDQALATTIFGTPQITSSRTEGYKYAIIPVSDAMHYVSTDAGAYFYTNAQGADWRYAGSSQEGMTCSDLPDSDALRAFAGVCTDGNIAG